MVETRARFAIDLETLIKYRLDMEFKEAMERIKAIILEKYDDELVDVVTDRDSKTNPNLYRDEFSKRLDNFEYIDDLSNTVSLQLPTMETFDFSGRLRIIEHIMEGLSGTYVEVNEEDYIKIFGKRPINEDPLDEYIPPKERIYLLRYDKRMRQAEQDLEKKFVRYPFSNSPPIRILDVAEKFVDDNIDTWIKEALEEAQREFVNTYKGVTL
jgi:hypothetical protein